MTEEQHRRAEQLVEQLRDMQYRTEAVELLDELAELLEADEHQAATGETHDETRRRLYGDAG